MQNNNGASFSDMSLDQALKEQILNDKSENSSLLRIKELIKNYINWEKNTYPIETKDELRKAISGGKLPKFDRFQDNFNGMGIRVHDTWATHITLKSLHIDNARYRAVVHYKVQDHFGLDSNDILKKNSVSSIFSASDLCSSDTMSLDSSHSCPIWKPL